MLISGHLARAQQTDQTFQYISINEGLSNAYVHTIAQDQMGYMWIGTDDGLNRYNGYEMMVYRHDPDVKNSLINNSVDALLLDHQQRLWIGTEDGLDRYDEDSDGFIHVSDTSHWAIRALFETQNGTIWVGTDNGIARYSEETKKLEKVPLKDVRASSNTIFDDSLFSINAFRAYNERYLVAGAWQGLCIIDLQEHTLEWINSTNDGHPINHIYALEIDGNGNIWIGMYGAGLFRYDLLTKQFHKVTLSNGAKMDNRIMHLCDDKKGHLWVATEQTGLYQLYINSYSPDGYDFVQYLDSDMPGSLSYRSVTYVFKDRSAGLWIGTHNGGVNYKGAGQTFFKTIRRNPLLSVSLSYKKVWGLCEDRAGYVWIGTDGGGLDQYDLNKGKIAHYAATGNPGDISDNAVLCGYKDNEGQLWFGTYAGGLNKFVAKTNAFVSYQHDDADTLSIGSNDVRCVLDGGKGELWVATNQGGLNLLDKETGHFTRFNPTNSALNSNDIRSLYKDGSGQLWIGTFDDGLYKYDGHTFHHYTSDVDAHYDNAIYSIAEDASGILWLGTYRTGLVRFDPKKDTFNVFDEKSGLANNIVHAVAVDEKNRIWLSSNKGVSVFNSDTESFQNFTTHDGLPTLAFNDGAVLRLHTGALCFGSLDGLVYFNPEDSYVQKDAPKVMLEKLKLFNKTVHPVPHNSAALLQKSMLNAKHLTFRSNQSVFTIQYAAINFPNAERLHYSYMLEGVDQQWNKVGTLRSATYTTLPSGDYVFKVRASLDNKNWSEATELAITILPPFWRSWWAYGLYAVMLAMVYYAITRYRINKFNMRRMIEIEKLEKKKLSEVYDMKMKFFTNISHEFRTPLTLIVSPLEQVIRNESVSAAVKNKLISIYNHAHRLHHLINQLMDFRKVETGHMQLKVTENDLVKFAYEVYHAFKELSVVNEVKYTFHSEVDKMPLWFNQRHFETILYNLISNAFKYTSSQGKIEVTIIQPDQENCEIRIKDNGKGISAAYLEQIFNRYFQVVEAETIHVMGTGIGLALVKDLVEMHKGRIEVNSQKHEGTEIVLAFKLGRAHFTEVQIIENAADSEHPQHYEIQEALHAEVQEEAEKKVRKAELLIVEDNHDIRKYIRSLFIEKYKILEAEDGDEGIELARSKQPAVIISDIMMPGTDGIELCKQLKNDSDTAHISIILLTARTDDLHKLEGISIGADDYITKPFDADILKAKVDTLIRNQSRLRAYFTSRILLEPKDEEVNAADKEFLDKAIALVEQNLLTSQFGIKDLMEALCVSQPTLYRRIKQLTGESTSEFIRSVRIKKAAEMIRLNQASITQIAYDVGFSSARYFRDSFFKIYKKTPSEYARECKEKGQKQDG